MPWTETVVHELHTKGLTKPHPDVPEHQRGTYAGLAHPWAGGIVPDMLGTQILPRLVGLDVAKQLTWLHPTVSGQEAVDLGAATLVADNPRAAAFELAAELCTKNPDAVRNAKHLLNLSWFGSFYEGAEGEQRSLRTIVASPNQLEATRAFLEKRPPVFVT